MTAWLETRLVMDGRKIAAHIRVIGGLPAKAEIPLGLDRAPAAPEEVEGRTVEIEGERFVIYGAHDVGRLGERIACTLIPTPADDPAPQQEETTNHDGKNKRGAARKGRRAPRD